MGKSKTLMVVPKDTGDKACKYEVLYINGKRIQIEKGKTVAVPPIYKEVYEEAVEQGVKGNTQKEELVILA